MNEELKKLYEQHEKVHKEAGALLDKYLKVQERKQELQEEIQREVMREKTRSQRQSRKLAEDAAHEESANG